MLIYEMIGNKIDSYDLLVVSDYNKDFLKLSLVKKVVDLFIHKGKRVIVDPKYDFHKYDGVYLIKPNIIELSKFVLK